MPVLDRLDFSARLEPRQATAAVRAVLVIGLIGGLAALGLSTRMAWHAWQALRSASNARPVAAAVPVRMKEPEAAPDFVQDLPTIAPTDAQIRFAARLARESQVELQRMQAEPMRTDPSHLGQVQLSLQLRGDYRDEKAVLGAMLAKFPGLTLEHLAIRHRGEGAASDAARSDDEATIELVQYLRPASS